MVFLKVDPEWDNGMPRSALIETGNDHRLADPESLGRMRDACVSVFANETNGPN
jgi:hypothetical protein